MRRQYHFRPGRQGFDAWDVDRLLALARPLPTETIPLAAFADLDTDYWFDHGYVPTVRAIVEHLRLIENADLSFPVVVDPDGRVMDGMHRVARALLEGRATIEARRLVSLPPPDYTDCQPDDLPYE